MKEYARIALEKVEDMNAAQQTRAAWDLMARFLTKNLISCLL